MNRGKKNEEDFINHINKNKFDQYTKVIQEFITFLFGESININLKFYSQIIKENSKPDILIMHNNKIKYISLKSGKGNSVHQEKSNEFFSFTNKLLGKEISDGIKLFHYADDSLDDSGQIRYSSAIAKKRYKKEIDIVNSKINLKNNLIIFLDRFIFKGNISELTVDAVYHGDINSGTWATREEIINYFIKKEYKSTSIHFAALNYQVWGRDENRKAKYPERRQVSQIKWSSIVNDLNYIRNKNNYVILGKENEIELVRYFNKNKHEYAEYLSQFNIKIDNYFLIKVATNQFSLLSNKKVKTRADAYLIKLEEKNNEILEKFDYYIDEKILSESNIKYSKIPNSGISIKLSNSFNFQIIKFTPKSFFNLFSNYELGAGASLYCDNIEDLEKNYQIINSWNSNIDKMSEYFKILIKENNKFYLDLDLCKKIKKYSNIQIKKLIIKNENLKSKIFNGIGIYQEPYTAHFIHFKDKIEKLDFIDFYVTTGSGRSKGNYSISLKVKRHYNQ